jgi:ATP-dependent Lon protease
MNLKVSEKQDLLEINDLQERALDTLKFMNIEFQKLEIKNDIQSKVQSDLNQQQREFFSSPTNENNSRRIRWG